MENVTIEISAKLVDDMVFRLSQIVSPDSLIWRDYERAAQWREYVKDILVRYNKEISPKPEPKPGEWWFVHWINNRATRSIHYCAESSGELHWQLTKGGNVFWKFSEWTPVARVENLPEGWGNG